jgi:acyl dehydratase
MTTPQATRQAPLPATPQVGAFARRTRTVTEQDIALFTEMTGDRNPLHYDRELAAASRFGGVVVQGGVTSGLLNALVAEQLPGPGSVFLETRWRYLAPVRPGDVLTAEATVTAARDDKPVTELATRVIDQDGTTVLDGTAVVWRDPVVASAAARTGRPSFLPAPTPAGPSGGTDPRRDLS